MESVTTHGVDQAAIRAEIEIATQEDPTTATVLAQVGVEGASAVTQEAAPGFMSRVACVVAEQVEAMSFGALAIVEDRIGMNLVDIPRMFRRAPTVEERIAAIPHRALVHELVTAEAARVKDLIAAHPDSFCFMNTEIEDLTPYVIVKLNLADQTNEFDIYGAFVSQDWAKEEKVHFTGLDLRYIRDVKQTGHRSLCDKLFAALPDKGVAKKVEKEFNDKVDEMWMFYLDETGYLAGDSSILSE